MKPLLTTAALLLGLLAASLAHANDHRPVDLPGTSMRECLTAGRIAGYNQADRLTLCMPAVRAHQQQERAWKQERATPAPYRERRDDTEPMSRRLFGR